MSTRSEMLIPTTATTSNTSTSARGAQQRMVADQQSTKPESTADSPGEQSVRTTVSKGATNAPQVTSSSTEFSHVGSAIILKGVKTSKTLRRRRKSKFPIHSSAQPAVKLLSMDMDEYYRPETAAEHRHKKKLKHKLIKLKTLSKAKAEQEGSSSTELQLAFQRPTFEERCEARHPKVNVWQSICEKIRSEKAEMDTILLKIGLPPHNFRKDKSFPVKEFLEPPKLESCYAQDFADYYIFPYLLPAIQSMILFARRNRVFQCVFCTFNPLDYITEYLYNNNPRYPGRFKSPVPLYDIPFTKEWIRKYPRKPFPKWLTMIPETAARIIQRAVRGWLVRKQPEIQEMRQFWRDYQRDLENDRRHTEYESQHALFAPYYEELQGEDSTSSIEIKIRPPTPFVTHSDTCFVCHRFRQFLRDQEELQVLSQQQAQERDEHDGGKDVGGPAVGLEYEDSSTKDLGDLGPV